MPSFPSDPKKKCGLVEKLRSEIERSWYEADSWRSPMLTALLGVGAKAYGFGLRHDQRRMLAQRRRLPAFVVSIGNLVAGGTGKTPFALWLSAFLRRRGRNPAILSRGYGGSVSESFKVPSEGDTALHAVRFGDEPVLMARRAHPTPVWAGRKRLASGEAALREGSDILILDDGFQHLALARDLDLVLLDARQPFGNGALLPLGPLREPPENLDRADAFILTRAENPEAVQKTGETLQRLFPAKPVFSCRHALAGFMKGLDGPMLPTEALVGSPVAAFAGIARPEAFFSSLEALGIPVRYSLQYPDHYCYGPADIARLVDIARKGDAHFLVTTEKDAVRLPAEIRSTVLVATLELEFGSDLVPLCSFLEERIMRG